MRARRLLALLPLLVACGNSSSGAFQPGGDAGAADGPVVAHESGALGGSDAALPVDGGGSPAGASLVYGQSADTLYALDPNTKAVSVVGNFEGCSQVIDIALDKSSDMYATTYDGIYQVDRATAACTLISHGSYPNSLSFVPAGTLDPSVEALVGYNGSTYVRIDPSTGALAAVGDLGGEYESSGDIVSVIGGGTYLTVTGGDCSEFDCLVEVNPKTGALVKSYGSTSHQEVYGIAFWAGTVYGFDAEGDLFSVSFPASGGLQIADIAIPDAPAGLSFYGAGSTTSAPVTPVSK